jgi:hypothetical protein
MQTVFPNLPNNPISLTETPGPHRLQHRPARPEDLEYQQRQSEQQRQEQQQHPNGNDPNAIDINNPNHILDIFKSLKVIANNNKHLHSGDISEPTPFNGADSEWDDWYLQLRTYLEAKDWLTTFEHPTGPGTAGFDLEINKKIHNKLHALCRKGIAATYITKAAHCDGWAAARFLLDRYEGFSKQRQRFHRQLIEKIRHVHGTNMSKHIDRFEKICGQLAHNNPTKSPTDEQKVDWFLDSVTEKTYDSVHATCTNKLLDGDLSFAKVIKLYTHRCIQRYPQFQLEDLESDSKKTVSNNSTSLETPRDREKEKGRGRQYNGEKGKGLGRPNPRYGSRPSRSSSHTKGRGRSKGKGSQRDKGNTSRPPTGTRKPADRERCSYCDKDGHNARNCYKRQNDDNTPKAKTTHNQSNLNIEVDEHALMFSQSVLSVYTSDSEPLHLSRWGETETNNATRNDGHSQQANNETREPDANQDEDPSTYPDTESPPSTEQTQRLNEEATLAKEKTEEGINQQGEIMQEDNSTNTLVGVEPNHDDIVGSSSSSTREDGHLREDLKTNKDVVTKQRSDKQESSSNPTWGKPREPTKEQLAEDWQISEQANRRETSVVYRHGRCHDCDKPVSSTNLDPGYMLICWECKPNVIEEEIKENKNEKRGFERATRDDEEEWKRIPIPTSDDSSDEYWLDEYPRSETENE